MDKFTRYIGIGFAICWMIFTFLEYWHYHEATRNALQDFQFPELSLILLLIGAALVFALARYKQHPASNYVVTGLGIALLSSLLAVICLNGYFYKNSGFLLSLSEDFAFLTNLLAVAGATYLVVLFTYAGGSLICQIFKVSYSPTLLHLVKIAVGIIFLVSLLFFLGLFGWLKVFILWPLLLLILFLSWRSAWRFIQMSLWKPIPALHHLNVLGLSIFYLLMIFISLNFVQVVRPFPIGFDAMTYYVNISALINDYDGLVQGYGAYNWSLFMSLGYLLFNQTAVVLSLSFVGGILSLLILNELSKKWLDANYSLLVVFLFYSLPMIAWLSYRDMKVDMGLLFYSLLIIVVFLEWLEPKKTASPKPAKKKKAKKNQRIRSPEMIALQSWVSKKTPKLLQNHAPLVLIGILAGFAIGIKFSALMILLALIPAIAYAQGNRMAFAAATALILFAVLFARFDTQAALRPLHLWADYLQWLLFLIGSGLTAYLFFQKRALFRRVATMVLLCTLMSGLVLSPWLIKNAIETRSLSISNLTRGKSASPRPSVQEIKSNYQNQDNEN